MIGKARKQRERKLEAASGYLELEMPEHALRELNAITDPEAIPFEFHQMRGEALRAAGKFEAALSAYSRALAEKPEDLGVLIGMAHCYKQSGQLQQAIAAMEEAYRTHPKEPTVLYHMARFYSLLGEKVQALSWLGRALRAKSSLRKNISDEPDFDSLRNDPDFQYVFGMFSE